MSGGVPAGELLPCPFCGTAPVVGGKDGTWSIYCRTVGCWSEDSPWVFDRVNNAVAAWNTRATPTPPIEGRGADVERVVEKMARAMYCADNDMSLEGNEAHLAYWFDNPDENDKGGVEEYRVMARAALQALGERP